MNWVKAYRKAHNLSQTALAKEIGVSRSLICLFEKGTRRPGIGLLPVIKAKLGIDPGDIRPDLAKHLR